MKKFNGMPLYFERNLGQSDPSVRYLSHSSRSSLFLTDDAAVITMVGGSIPKKGAGSPASCRFNNKLVESAIRIRLVGANKHPQFQALEPLRGRINYLIGNDPSKFHRNVPIFGRVKIKNVYPGIDLVYYGTPQALEYDLIAAPGADTSKLKFAVEGGTKTAVEANGNLVISAVAALSRCKSRACISRMPPARRRRSRETSRWPVMAPSMRVFLGAKWPSTSPLRSHRTLTIDPTVNQIVYSTYLGGTGTSTGPFFQREYFALLGRRQHPVSGCRRRHRCGHRSG